MRRLPRQHLSLNFGGVHLCRANFELQVGGCAGTAALPAAGTHCGRRPLLTRSGQSKENPMLLLDVNDSVY